MAGARPPTGIPRPPRIHAGGRPVIDLAGQRFGKMLVVERVAKPTAPTLTHTKGTWWSCQCSCGRDVVFNGQRLRAGSVLDCGGAWHKATRR